MLTPAQGWGAREYPVTTLSQKASKPLLVELFCNTSWSVNIPTGMMHTPKQSTWMQGRTRHWCQSRQACDPVAELLWCVDRQLGVLATMYSEGSSSRSQYLDLSRDMGWHRQCGKNTYMFVSLYIYIYMYIHTLLNTCVCMYIYIYVYIILYIYVQMCVRTCSQLAVSPCHLDIHLCIRIYV